MCKQQNNIYTIYGDGATAKFTINKGFRCWNIDLENYEDSRNHAVVDNQIEMLIKNNPCYTTETHTQLWDNTNILHIFHNT